jgi:hypothetical protein
MTASDNLDDVVAVDKGKMEYTRLGSARSGLSELRVPCPRSAKVGVACWSQNQV